MVHRVRQDLGKASGWTRRRLWLDVTEWVRGFLIYPVGYLRAIAVAAWGFVIS